MKLERNNREKIDIENGDGDLNKETGGLGLLF